MWGTCSLLVGCWVEWWCGRSLPSVIIVGCSCLLMIVGGSCRHCKGAHCCWLHAVHGGGWLLWAIVGHCCRFSPCVDGIHGQSLSLLHPCHVCVLVVGMGHCCGCSLLFVFMGCHWSLLWLFITMHGCGQSLFVMVVCW